jgi:hypothetical protein
MPKSNDGTIQLVRLNRVRANIWIVGTAPLIMHKWSEKALASMPGAPGTSGPKPKKGLREPEEEATACLYTFPDGGIGFPATGFKAATIGACRLFDKPSMVEAKQLIFVEGELSGTDQLVRIFYRGEPTLRTDAPRLANGGTDLRYRYQFYPWWACLKVHFIPTSISEPSIIALVDAAGLGGVGEWRPSSPRSSTGTYGTFRVMLDEEKKAYEVFDEEKNEVE